METTSSQAGCASLSPRGPSVRHIATDDAAFRDPRVIDMSQTLRLVTYNLQRGIRYEQIRHHLDTVPLLRQVMLREPGRLSEVPGEEKS